MSDRSTRTAFVAEECDLVESGRLTGLFQVGWQDDEAGEHERGLEGVSAEEAIAWGRKRAARVFVRLGEEDQYSAGERPIPGLPLWPEGGIPVRPRPIGAARDGSEQEIDWLVRGTVRGAAWMEEPHLAALDERIRAHDRVRDLTIERERTDLVLSCTYFARSMRAAVGETDTLFGATIESLLPERGPGGARLVGVSGVGPANGAPWSTSAAPAHL
jgi:hypothetical protein